LTSPSYEESPGNIDEGMIFLMEMENHEEEDLKFLKNLCRHGALPLNNSFIPFFPYQINHLAERNSSHSSFQIVLHD
jgi:hypothetical protein